MKEKIDNIITNLESIKEILFAMQLLDREGKNEVYFFKLLELPINELNNIKNELENIEILLPKNSQK